MDTFTTSPEDFLSEILSRTSPPDAARLAVISKGFKSAAGSDAVWDRFLPSDWPENLSSAISPVVYTTKRELYYNLCHAPVLVDGGKLSFSLEKRSGKKCYMVGARELVISWGDTPMYWKWTSCAESRFSEVAELKIVCWLDIRGKITTRMLSPNTTYGAYLVFKLADGFHGLESANAVVRLVNREADSDAKRRAAIVHLQRASGGSFWGGSQQQTGKLRARRGDGWLEIEMGSFYNDQGDDGAAEARLMEIDRLGSKSGLIVEGIEFRPKT